ncbi:hypothetical protein PR048_030840 [Dryococelus australis]|uniref:Uncharacterized protein n=1 Tax=Dryococelus australis TaxID=614101 RepID=A0ABQ9GAG3_9NEOP|nr:hypothetical protein PR048_030840 [Dryococelus australis]
MIKNIWCQERGHHDDIVTVSVSISVLQDCFFRPSSHLAVETMLKRCTRRKISSEEIRVQSPAGSLPIFAIGNRTGRCRRSAAFLGDLPFLPQFHSGAAPYSPQSPSSALRTSMLRAVQISSLRSLFLKKHIEQHSFSSYAYVRMEQRRNARAGNRETPEKTRRPAASPGTISISENPGGGDPPGIKPVSPSLKTSSLTTRPPRPLGRGLMIVEWGVSNRSGSTTLSLHYSAVVCKQSGVPQTDPSYVFSSSWSVGVCELAGPLDELREIFGWHSTAEDELSGSRSVAGMKGRGENGRSPRKPSDQRVSSGTIPSSDNTGSNPAENRTRFDERFRPQLFRVAVVNILPASRPDSRFGDQALGSDHPSSPQFCIAYEPELPLKINTYQCLHGSLDNNAARDKSWVSPNHRMEQRLNERAGEAGDPRGNPSTSGIIRHDSHMRKSGKIGNSIAELILLAREFSEVCQTYFQPVTGVGQTYSNLQFSLSFNNNANFAQLMSGPPRTTLRVEKKTLGRGGGLEYRAAIFPDTFPLIRLAEREVLCGPTPHHPYSYLPFCSIAAERGRGEKEIEVVREGHYSSAAGSSANKYQLYDGGTERERECLQIRLPACQLPVGGASQIFHFLHVDVKIGAAPECKDEGNCGDPRENPADQRHRTTRFPRAKILEPPRREIEPGSPWWKASALATTPPRPPTSLGLIANPALVSRHTHLLEVIAGVGGHHGAVSPLASHQGEKGSIPGRVVPDFRMWESCWTMPLVDGFSPGSPVSFAPSFRRCSILSSITRIGSQDLAWAELRLPTAAVIGSRAFGGRFGRLRSGRPKERGAEGERERGAGSSRLSRLALPPPSPDLSFVVGPEFRRGLFLLFMLPHLPPLRFRSYTGRPEGDLNLSRGIFRIGLRFRGVVAPPSGFFWSPVWLFRAFASDYVSVFGEGAAVGRRLGRSPPTESNRARFPAVSLPDFRVGETCRTMPLVGGFAWGSPPPLIPLSFRRCSIIASITLIGSQDLAVKSRSNLFTHYFVLA